MKVEHALVVALYVWWVWSPDGPSLTLLSVVRDGKREAALVLRPKDVVVMLGAVAVLVLW